MEKPNRPCNTKKSISLQFLTISDETASLRFTIYKYCRINEFNFIYKCPRIE